MRMICPPASAVLLSLLLALTTSATAVHGASAGCQFVLGFADMAAAVPEVGKCIDNQTYAANGDAVQHTTGGLLVWRKWDNFLAFTNGARTWVNGPQGIQQRANAERFSWEAAQPTPSVTSPDLPRRPAADAPRPSAPASAPAAAVQPVDALQQQAIACNQGGNIWVGLGQQMYTSVGGQLFLFTGPGCMPRPEPSRSISCTTTPGWGLGSSRTECS